MFSRNIIFNFVCISTNKNIRTLDVYSEVNFWKYMRLAALHLVLRLQSRSIVNAAKSFYPLQINAQWIRETVLDFVDKASFDYNKTANKDVRVATAMISRPSHADRKCTHSSSWEETEMSKNGNKIKNKGTLTSFYNVNERKWKTKTKVQISFSEFVGKR